MKKYLLLYSIALFSLSCNKRAEQTFEKKVGPSKSVEIGVNNLKVPEELNPFVPVGYVVYDFFDGDLNGDSLEDYILITGKKQPITSDEQTEEKLQVQLLVRGNNNSLKLHSINKEMLSIDDVMSDSEGLVYFPNNEIELDPNGKGFIVAFRTSGAGATSSSSNLHYYFQYNKKANDWLLTKAIDSVEFNSPAAAIGAGLETAKEETPNITDQQLDSIESDLEENYYSELSPVITTPKDFGIIPFKKFKMGI